MNLSLSLMLTVVLTVSMTAVVLLTLNSNGYAITANTTDFSVNVSDNWAYADAQLTNLGSGIIVIPTEFSDSLMTPAGDSQKLFQNLSVWSAMNIDTAYPFRNVPLEIYVQHMVNASSDVFRKWPQVPTLIDGERSLKIWGDVADNSTITNKMVGYYVFHEGIPYRLEYYATEKDYEKYLPQFEKMVSSFKFTK